MQDNGSGLSVFVIQPENNATNFMIAKSLFSRNLVGAHLAEKRQKPITIRISVDECNVRRN